MSGPAGRRDALRPAGRRDAQSYLLDLVTNTLDPGYAAAHARRAGRGADANRPLANRVLVALGALIAGFVLVLAWVHANRAAPTAAKVHTALVSRVRAAQATADGLTRTAGKLSDQVGALRDAALSANGAGAGPTAQQVQRDELLAGMLAATGPGAQVTLADPGNGAATAPPTAGRPGTTPQPSTHIITDRDVRAVVNELWADGAEAIAVNGVRLTAVSAIRFAGQAVLVDFQPVVSPYRIDAIGDPDRLVTSFADSPVASRYQTLVGARGIQFGFGEQRRLTIPAGAPITLHDARPAR